MQLTYGSLFTGIGGFDLGFDRSGMRCVWQVERDRQCLELLAQKWPNVKRVDDVCKVRFKNVREVQRGEAPNGVPQAGETQTPLLVQGVLQRIRTFDEKPENQTELIQEVEPIHEVSPSGTGLGGNEKSPRRRVRNLQKGNEKSLRGSLPCDEKGTRATVPPLQHPVGDHRGQGVQGGGDDLPFCDVICGGFPCQDVSVAGKRAGLAGDRSGLFFEITRIIKEMRHASENIYPTFAVLENVPGLLSSNGGRDFAAVIQGLAESGAMDIAWAVLDSQWFGLAQRRKRVFIVADFRGQRAGEILSVPYGMRGNSPPSRETREGVARTLEARVDGGGFPGSDGAMSGHVVAATLRSRQSKPGVSMPGRGGEDDQNLVVAFAQNTRDEVREIGGNIAGALPAQPGMKQQTYVAMTLNEKNGKRYDAESETFVTHALTGNGFDASEDGTGRGTPLVAQTLKGNTGRLHIESDYVPQRQGVRRLVPIECERLQGFPDGWTAGFSDSCRYKMLGNAVSTPVIFWIGKRLIEAS